MTRLQLLPEYEDSESKSIRSGSRLSVASKSIRTSSSAHEKESLKTTLGNTTRNETVLTRTTQSVSRATSRQQRYIPGDSHGHEWCVALSEGRGVSAEIGLVAFDKTTSQCILAQYSDSPAFHLTLHKLSMLSPSEILFSHTAVHPTPSKLYQAIIEYINDATEIIVGPRRDFNDKEGLDSLEKYGVQGTMNHFDTEFSSKYYCLCALSALFAHLEKNHRIGFIRHSVKFQYETPGACMAIDSVTRKNLELVRSIDGKASKSDLCLFKILNKTCTALGCNQSKIFICHTSLSSYTLHITLARLLRKTILQPHYDVEIIDRKLDGVQELLQNPKMAIRIEDTLKNMLDIDRLISSLVQVPLEQTAKTAEQTVNNLVILKHILHYSEVLLDDLNEAESMILYEIREILQSCKEAGLMADINTVLNDDVRHEKKPLGLRNQRAFAVREGLHGLLDVARQAYREAMNDAYGMVTDYSEKYGLPIQCDFLPGVGYMLTLSLAELKKMSVSETLPDVFINVTKKKKLLQFTTLRLKSQNERIHESLTEIYLISDKITSDLLERTREQISLLYSLSESIALLDLLVSFASYASSAQTSRPEFTKTLAIKNGRHPILEKVDRSFVPNDTYADSRSHLQILTGVNCSGKTTYLKQIGLLVILAQIGCFVPAEYMSLRLTDALFSRLGNDDCLEANASSFMVEMMETVYLLNNATGNSLVLIDELGRGTSTTDGIGISVAVCEEFLEVSMVQQGGPEAEKTRERRGCFVYVVTHFPELALVMQCYSGCVLLQMDTQISLSNSSTSMVQDQEEAPQSKSTLKYTYSVKNGICQHENYGVLIAERAGLPQSILDRARQVSREQKDKAENLKALNGADADVKKMATAQKQVDCLKSLLHVHRHSKLDQHSLQKIYYALHEKARLLLNDT